MQDHQIAGHHLAPGDAPLRAAAQHQRAWAREVAQGLQRALGLAALVDGDAHHDEHRHQQDQRLLQVAECQVDRAAGNQQQEHRLAQHLERDAERPAPRRSAARSGPSAASRREASASRRPGDGAEGETLLSRSCSSTSAHVLRRR